MFYVEELGMTSVLVAELSQLSLDPRSIRVTYGDRLEEPTFYEDIKNRDGVPVIRFMIHKKEGDTPSGFNLMYFESVYVVLTPEEILNKYSIDRLNELFYTLKHQNLPALEGLDKSIDGLRESINVDPRCVS